MTALYVIIGLIVLAVVVARLYLCVAGVEDIVVDTSAPFVVEEKTAEHIVIIKQLAFRNEGKQCATLMDAFVRPQLPYEQYDGIEAHGCMDRELYPREAKDGQAGERIRREDNYFEAVIIQKKGDPSHEDKLNLYAMVELKPRKGMTLDEALTKMVDVPLDCIWQETGRRPWHYRKVQCILTAEEIAKLAGVQLALD